MSDGEVTQVQEFDLVGLQRLAEEWAKPPIIPLPLDPNLILYLLARLDAQQAVVVAAQKRIGGSHAMGCDAYLSDRFLCDCGRDDLRSALKNLR